MPQDRISSGKTTAYFHLPGLFEFYELYKRFLPLFFEHREYFYEWCGIGSIYGAPAGCIWGGGRVGEGDQDPGEVLALLEKYGISARLTFSNSLLREEHLADRKCNALCAMFEEERENEKRRYRSFGAFAGVFKKEISRPLFCFLHHKGTDRF